MQNHKPRDAPKFLPVVGRPGGKDKKRKVITVLSDCYRPATGHWAEPGVGSDLSRDSPKSPTLIPKSEPLAPLSLHGKP